MHIMRNTRSTHFKEEPTWGEVALPAKSGQFEHVALSIHNRDDRPNSALEDMEKLQEVFGGRLVKYTGKEWFKLCKDAGSMHKQPVGAQFAKEYALLLFNLCPSSTH
jgi:hypothetical protein